MNFENNHINISQLPNFQSIDFQSLAKEKLKVNYIVSSLFYLVILIIYVVLKHFIEEFQPDYSIFFGIFFCLILIHFVYLNFSYKNQFYALRSKDILYKSGVFTKSTTIIPFNRVQHLVVDQGFISRKFNLANIELFTAGGNDLKINGLYFEDAQKIKEFITANINNEKSLDIELLNDHLIEEDKNLSHD